jgi:zinc transporter ZupT
MEINISKLLLYTLGIFSISILGAILPLFRQWSDQQLHRFIAFGAGVFLGAIFLHLLPDTMAEASGILAGSMILTGFLIILLVERIILGSHNVKCGDDCDHRHEIVGVIAMIGLSVHSLTAGFGLGVGMTEPALGLIIFVAILAHKATASFSLATIFKLANYSRKKNMILILLFSMMTPLGALLSLPFIDSLRDVSLAIPTGITTGTFLYVATIDLLPEAFHDNENRITRFCWLMAGIILMYFIKMGGA